MASGSIVDVTVSMRIVSTAEAGREGESIAIAAPIDIGRDAACPVVIRDASVSRKHARVEPAAEGLRVIDLGSGNGVWVGAERVTDVVLTGGQRFRVGSTVFECLVTWPPPPPAPVAPTTEALRLGALPARLMVRIVDGGLAEESGHEFVVEKESVTIGRAADCDVVLRARDLSRHHASLEVTTVGVRLTDLQSRYGTWVDDQEITSVLLTPDQLFRLGTHTVLQCVAIEGSPIEARPDSAPDPDLTRLISRPVDLAGGRPIAEAVDAPGPGPSVALGHTVVMPAPTEPVVSKWRIEEEGEQLAVSAHDPFLLDDPESAWYVISGGILIFTVALENGEAVGNRTLFCDIAPAQMFFGFDTKAYGAGSAFLAVAKQGTTVRKIPVARLRQVAADSTSRPAIGAWLDAWVTGLSAALAADLPMNRPDEIVLRHGERVSLDENATATSGHDVVWVSVWSGSVLFDDMATVSAPRRDVLFPLASKSWIRPVSDELTPLALRPIATADVVGSDDLWAGLETFHQILCECEFVNKKLALADEFIRLRHKSRQAEVAREEAYDAIGSVMRTERSTPAEFRSRGDAEPVLHACQLVASAIGLEAKAHPSTDAVLTYEERVTAIATASGFRTRVVALRDDWWTEDNGPLLGQLAGSMDPVALLPNGPRAYVCIDATTGNRTPVTAAVSQKLSGFAHTLYRPLPEGSLRASDLVRFGIRGVKKDLLWVLYMAIIVGVFGTVTPFITGQVFDAAIPQAQRTALIGFGIALVVAAAAGALFKYVQGVATTRIQTRMSSTIQAAVWDRILNLPTTFFRKFSAGDLADRANGVEAIQGLLAGAGVAAILGSVSGLFYVVQMFSFNLRLALIAIVLTFVYVFVNMTANYLQLRYQRAELQLKGRITGLVLNLLTGVTKLRVCAAEHHAFRVWAEQFAQQRRISFTVGMIQNVAAGFTVIFPIISSIAIFATMVSVQAAGAPEQLTTGDFIAFNAAFGLFLAAMTALGDASLSLLRVVPIYERLSPILTTAPETDTSKAFPGKLKGRIELSHVYFRYEADGPWIVNDVSLVIEPGEFVAFVGSSGGGKSTVLRLMLGFETPSRGSVLFDGQDLSSLDMRMVRQQLGVVLQTSRVMPTEMYRNIVGVTSRTIDEAWDAAEKAGLADDIRAMPMGMHTYVSEGGGTLSGGQRQRLMIARAIVNKPKILFLDEATSALDNRAQATVTESMDRMDATRIVIAHRLSTVANAHRICYLHGGQIAEVGSYDELMKKDGLFAQLAKRQMA
jgi:NHLM bacteriocin system ABC transporter ATP-binding protein